MYVVATVVAPSCPSLSAPRSLLLQAKASEGMAYNIVSNAEKDEGRLRKLEESQANSTLTRVRTQVEHYMSAAGAATEDRGACIGPVSEAGTFAYVWQLGCVAGIVVTQTRRAYLVESPNADSTNQLCTATTSLPTNALLAWMRRHRSAAVRHLRR